jgi:hypothetical protein
MEMKINVSNIKVAPLEKEAVKKRDDDKSYYELGKLECGIKGKAVYVRG